MKLGILIVVLCTSILGAAYADTGGVTDPADQAWGNVDIGLIEHSHEKYADGVAGKTRTLLTHTVTMHEAWNYEEPGGLDLVLSFNTDRDRRVERELRLHVQDPANPYAEMTDAKGRIRGYARISRPDELAITFAFPKGLFGRNLTRYRWKAVATSDFTPPPECQAPNPPCPLPQPQDAAPDRGRVIHRL